MWTSTRFYSKPHQDPNHPDPVVTSWPFLNNQIFNPTILFGVTSDEFPNVDYPFTISMDVEIRLEYRGANMTG